jgi:hypothetical protein
MAVRVAYRSLSENRQPENQHRYQVDTQQYPADISVSSGQLLMITGNKWH